MATSIAELRIQATTVDNVTWTAFTSPINANTCIVRNTGSVALKLRSDSADASTEFAINPGQEYTFGGPFAPPHSDNRRFRFETGTTVILAQASSGSSTIMQVFL